MDSNAPDHEEMKAKLKKCHGFLRKLGRVMKEVNFCKNIVTLMFSILVSVSKSRKDPY